MGWQDAPVITQDPPTTGWQSAPVIDPGKTEAAGIKARQDEAARALRHAQSDPIHAARQGIRKPSDIDPRYDTEEIEPSGILPISPGKETGATHLVLPEIISGPAKLAAEGGEMMAGTRPIPSSQTSGDERPDLQTLPQMAALGAGAGFSPKRLPATAPAVNLGAQAAHDAGYVLHPSMVTDSPGAVNTALSGWAGKDKLNQKLSEKNQDNTNGLARKAIGVDADTTLTENVFDGIRAKAGEAYDAVRDSISRVVPDRGFRQIVSGLGQANTAAAKTFPNLMRNPEIELLQKELAAVQEFTPEAGIGLVKDLRFRAKNNMRNQDPAKIELGFAQRHAADAIDELIERNIEASARPEMVSVGGKVYELSKGDPKLAGLVQKYREARQLIAKTYDVESVTNTATGDVSARGLAALARRGKPMTGELKTIADAANTFPKALQNPAAFGGVEPLSVLDVFGAGLSAAHGNPGMASMFLGRPLARSAMASRPMQNRMFAAPKQSQMADPVLRLSPPLSSAVEQRDLSDIAQDAEQ